jgi:hypothetical protein
LLVRDVGEKKLVQNVREEKLVRNVGEKRLSGTSEFTVPTPWTRSRVSSIKLDA